MVKRDMLNMIKNDLVRGLGLQAPDSTTMVTGAPPLVVDGNTAPFR